MCAECAPRARTGTIPLIMVEWDTNGTSSRSFFCIALAILAQKNQVDVRGELEKPTKEMYDACRDYYVTSGLDSHWYRVPGESSTTS